MVAASTYGLAEKLDMLGGSILSILPEIILTATFLLMLIGEISFAKKRKILLPIMGTLGIVLAATVIILHWGYMPPRGAFLGMVIPDGLSGVFRLLFALATIVTLWVSRGSRRLSGESQGMGEYYLVVMAMLLGMHFMSMASNLLMMYLALELVSLPSYILTAYARLSRGSAEASLKYIIYGAFSSGIMLYGISWLYGITGTLDPLDPNFAAGLEIVGSGPATFVLVLVLCGFAFKISSLPFHFWTPDVYEGAPYPVAGFFAVAPKAAGFIMLMRFLPSIPEEMEGLRFNMMVALGLMAIVGMTLGNLAAIRQENIRRMLAWSSIAQAGYLLMGVLIFSVSGFAATTFYLVMYFFMTMGAFLAAGWVFEKLGTEKIQDYKGLGRGLPLLAIAIVIFMVSLTGLPPTGGFIAKLELFLAMIESYGNTGQVWLVVIMVAAVINTVISLFYYLRVPVMMIFHNPSIKILPAFRGLVPVLITIMALAVLLFGIIYFDALINFIREQIESGSFIYHK